MKKTIEDKKMSLRPKISLNLAQITMTPKMDELITNEKQGKD